MQASNPLIQLLCLLVCALPMNYNHWPAFLWLNISSLALIQDLLQYYTSAQAWALHITAITGHISFKYILQDDLIVQHRYEMSRACWTIELIGIISHDFFPWVLFFYSSLHYIGLCTLLIIHFSLSCPGAISAPRFESQFEKVRGLIERLWPIKRARVRFLQHLNVLSLLDF